MAPFYGYLSAHTLLPASRVQYQYHTAYRDSPWGAVPRLGTLQDASPTEVWIYLTQETSAYITALHAILPKGSILFLGRIFARILESRWCQ